MATPRYRRIVADQFIGGPRKWVLSRRCSENVVPGTAMILGPDTMFSIAKANQAGPIYIADLPWAPAGASVYDFYDSTIDGLQLPTPYALNVVVPTGISVTKGMGLTTNAVGWFVPATAGQRVIMTADETYNNDTGVYQHVRALPA